MQRRKRTRMTLKKSTAKPMSKRKIDNKTSKTIEKTTVQAKHAETIRWKRNTRRQLMEKTVKYWRKDAETPRKKNRNSWLRWATLFLTNLGILAKGYPYSDISGTKNVFVYAIRKNIYLSEIVILVYVNSRQCFPYFWLQIRKCYAQNTSFEMWFVFEPMRDTPEFLGYDHSRVVRRNVGISECS